MKLFTFYLVVLSSALLFGCGGYSVTVPVQRAADIPLNGYTKLIVTEFRGEHGDRFTYEVVKALRQKNVYQVLSSDEWVVLMSRHNLAANALLDDRGAADVEAKIGKVAILSGRVIDHQYTEQTSRDNYKDKDGKAHTRYIREGKADVGIQYQVTDFARGTTLGSNEANDVRKTTESNTDAQARRIDDLSLLSQARSNCLSKLMRSLTPYEDRIFVVLYDDDKMPELVKGVELAENKRWSHAIPILTEVVQKYSLHSNVHKAYYDLGVCYMFDGDYKKAEEALSKALTMEPGDNAYNHVYDLCIQLSSGTVKARK